MIYTHMTTAELMKHFRIRPELYSTFASWLVAHAREYELMVPGTENHARRRYDFRKVAEHYERRWHFGTADAVQAPAKPELSDREALHAEVVAARRERRKAAVALMRNARRHATHAMIADSHAELSEARCEKYLKLLGLEFVMQKAARWAFLGLTGAALIISIATTIITLCRHA